MQHTVHKADTGEIGERQLANSAHGAAHSGRAESALLLFAALARAAEPRLLEFKAQSFANMAWVFATVKESDEKLFTASSRAAERRVGELRL